MKQKRRQIIMTLALAAIVGSTTGQTLSVATIEAKAGEGAEIVVNNQSDQTTTALQFNLHLPTGFTLGAAATSSPATLLGAAASSHTLDIRPLGSGDYLFVFYSLDMRPLGTGELVRIPITYAMTATTQAGSLKQVHSSKSDAVSESAEDEPFALAVVKEKGDVNEDGTVTIADVTKLVNIVLGK